MKYLILVLVSLLPLSLAAQNSYNLIGAPSPSSSDSSPNPESSPAADDTNASTDNSTKNSRSQNPSIAGIEIPVFDPANDSVQWNGKLWQVDNNRLFRARFEKYLNTPAAELKAQKAYDVVINHIMDLLSAGKTSDANLDKAFALLPQAAAHEEDANLSDAIANQVLGAWQSKRQMARIERANSSLEEERKRHEWNARMSAQDGALSNSSPPKNPAAAKQWEKERETLRNARMQPHAQRLTEVNALLNANRLKSELSALQARIEFQTLIAQLFLQRRFRHTLIATRFYRTIFTDGDNQLRLGNETKSFFDKLSGAPPTVTTLDALANEAIKDVRESVQAVEYMLQKDELQSATSRLGEAFAIGEHLPEIREFSRPDRQRILVFARKANQLLSAIEVKDYTRAESLANDLQNSAKDFDPTQAIAAVQTARNVSRMHLGRARNAALSGDAATLESELRAATEIWPNNPDLTEISSKIFEQTDTQQQALIELDRLIEQGDQRSIFNQSAKFIAATALHPDRQEKLKKILEEMTEIETAIQRAREIQLRGDAIGAWENIQIAATKYPNDNELNRLRADLAASGAATFVQSLNKGSDLETRGEYGAALAWFLDAHRQYPPSQFAKEHIESISHRILPSSSTTTP